VINRNYLRPIRTFTGNLNFI